MKTFPKTLYITAIVHDEGDTEYFVETRKEFIEDNDIDTEVAVYQLVKTGRVEKKSRIVFDD